MNWLPVSYRLGRTAPTSGGIQALHTYMDVTDENYSPRGHHRYPRRSYLLEVELATPHTHPRGIHARIRGV